MTITLPPSATCASGATAISVDHAVNRRNQSMLHLHGFDDSNPLAAGDARTLVHQERKHLAMHRRAYKTAFVLIPSLVKHCVAQCDFCLTAMA